jgi:hypothetical protein
LLSALLDTCVLVPSRARDVLLEIGSTGAYRPLWSAEILDELDRTLVSSSASEDLRRKRSTLTSLALCGR